MEAGTNGTYEHVIERDLFTCSFVRSPNSPCSAGASAGPRASRAVWSPPGSLLRHSTAYRSAPPCGPNSLSAPGDPTRALALHCDTVTTREFGDAAVGLQRSPALVLRRLQRREARAD
ncbi:unnamed protein product, partial [Brenthis ino]